jgi:hypothetical protein
MLSPFADVVTPFVARTDAENCCCESDYTPPDSAGPVQDICDAFWNVTDRFFSGCTSVHLWDPHHATRALNQSTIQRSLLISGQLRRTTSRC